MLHSLLSKLALVLISPFFLLLNTAGYHITQTPALGSSNAIESPVALFSTSLASSITSSASSMTLTSATTLDGTSLASSTYSFIIDEGTASQEFVKADCTGTACVRMARGLSSLDGTTTVAVLRFAHRRAASVKITDAPLLLNLTRILNGIGTIPNVLSYTSSSTIATSTLQVPYAGWVASGFTDVYNNQSIGGVKTFTSLPTIPLTPSASTDAASKGYVDGVAVAGAPNANTTTKGIAQEATAAQIIAGTQAGSTGAELFVNPSFLLASGISVASFSTTTAQNLATTTIRASELPAGSNLRLTLRSPDMVGSASTTNSATIWMAFNVLTDSGTSAQYFTNWNKNVTNNNKSGTNVAQLNGGPASGFVNTGVRNMQTDLDLTVNNTSGASAKFGQYALWQVSTSTNNGSPQQDGINVGSFNFSSTTAAITSIDIWTGTNAVGTVCSTACFATGTQIRVEGY